MNTAHLAALGDQVLQERRQQLEAVALLNLGAQPLHRNERPHAQDEVVHEVVWCLRIQERANNLWGTCRVHLQTSRGPRCPALHAVGKPGCSVTATASTDSDKSHLLYVALNVSQHVVGVQVLREVADHIKAVTHIDERPA